MRAIIKNDQVIDDQWTLLSAEADLDEALRTEQAIIPFALWQEHKSQLQAVKPLGVWLESNQAVEDLAEDLAYFSVVALNFPVFTDGRHFSSARLLRERYAYTGEIRAIGDVARDQLFFMQRCGFDAYAIRADRCPVDALQSLTDFSVTYQAAYDQSLPLYRRRTA
ncbi:MAG: DUF934 domain-containing protein [Thiopseudomonas sp.]|jgi:uncharacterized protein (DUF934 family)|uniref:DUF934 domain-containing protein n=1 Tax=Denitrificimonas caeni TaxID=521720 RepID=UPI0003B5D30C|nr:DUF934 domain-containing protein [Denitrificimonas caeni]MBP7189463.1 DUF934 domain-containing protein [Thiopseudomonas sp.]HHX05378.1 DUF934 domain-containing protein [Pseudomonas sp.]MBP7958610.1 DUF934 domain-containing protein [Thiopseudomonas sp.]MBP7997095.1 DUF934 domain-containing protein [Thiopseudomonas sp.]MBP8771144.1 DUF934 domain-containing protein [Thiopseudomonas sp.]